MRMSCLRRRVWMRTGTVRGLVIDWICWWLRACVCVCPSSREGSVTSLHGNDALTGSALCARVRMSIEALPMLRRHHAVAVQQQRRHPDELLQFHQCFLVLFVAFVLRLRRGKLGYVGERFTAVFGQRGCGPSREPETAENAAAPV